MVVQVYRIDWWSVRTESAYLYRNFGASHFGDFEFKVTVTIVAHENTSRFDVVTLANMVGDLKAIQDSLGAAVGVLFYVDGSGIHYLYAQEYYNGTAYSSSSYAYAHNVPYYLTIKKLGTAFTCKVYSDSARTNLLATLSLTLHADHHFQYVYPCCTYNDGTNRYCDGDITDLDLQEEIPPPPEENYGIINIPIIPPF